jgi:spore maturation protein SpmB
MDGTQIPVQGPSGFAIAVIANINRSAPTGGNVVIVGMKKGLWTFWILMKIMVPVYVIVTLLNHTPALAAIAHFFEPYMGIWRLPGDAALALVLGYVVNLYAAIAVIAAGGWEPASVTIAGVILGVSHSLIMEGAILRQMRAPAALVIIMRVVLGLVLGYVVAQLLPG